MSKHTAKYTVGTTEDGKTVLDIPIEGGSTSLTMNEAAVCQLIRMLAATLYEWRITIEQWGKDATDETIST